MNDRTVNGEVETVRSPTMAQPPRPATRRGFGLSARLFVLTVLFVTVSEVLIYVPSIANFRINWLADHLTMADAASLVLAESDEQAVPREIQNELLKSVGAIAIAVRTGTVSRLIATVEMPPDVDSMVDLRVMNLTADISDAFATLFSPTPRTIRVVGAARSGATLEVVISDRPLRDAMVRYSVNIIWLSLLISVITGVLLYLSINRLFVRPMRRLTDNMVAFSSAPEDTAKVIVPSGRSDEIGVAEEHLAAMQETLQGTLREQRHLADLGLAVSKINHDLRNMLAAAQIFSDRLGSLPDENVQRFAPKLIAALDRAISYAQTTLAYGKAREAAPSRRLLALDRLVDDVADSVGLANHPAIQFENRVPAGLEIDADPDQLLRVLVNLCRNAVQALEGDFGPAVVRRLTVSASRTNGSVAIRVADTGPGIPPNVRANLFRAFQGTARPGGTGLGLVIAAELVRAHGGAIALLDTGGAGATFEVVIPDRPSAGSRMG
ncbi:MAG TPA: HAMP domain-containing sensor histidine kinase [Bauldia sp.]|nr:HAMP domain-containing sensor histidine kinase [Bauldia sp.]